MKILSIAILLCFSTLSSYAAESQMITTDDLERRYGAGTNSSTSDDKHAAGTYNADPGTVAGGSGCSVVNYNSYDETRTVNMPATYSGVNIGGVTSGVVTGGNSVNVKGPTFLSITVKNNSQSRKVFNVRDVKVITVKGNTVNPDQSQAKYLLPGESVTITGIKLIPLSAIANVSIECSDY